MGITLQSSTNKFFAALYFVFAFLTMYVVGYSQSKPINKTVQPQNFDGGSFSNDTEAKKRLPSVKFVSSTIKASESAGVVKLTVELVEPHASSIEVEINFKAGSGSASRSDINGFSSERVKFISSDSSGTQKSVNVQIVDDSDVEGDEIAVFVLQNISNGSISSPRELQLTIADNDVPNIVFNEINADPGDDANGDGSVGSRADQFIELVNNSNRALNISKWKYSHGANGGFVFPEETIIPAGGAVVLFEGDVRFVNKNFGGAIIFENVSLGLNNSSGVLKLNNENGNTVALSMFENSIKGESGNISPDVTGNRFVEHSSLATYKLSSPGTRINGKAFSSSFAKNVRPGEQWSFVASPAQNTRFDDILPGSVDPSSSTSQFYQWNKRSDSYEAVPNLANVMEAGRGYLVYWGEENRSSNNRSLKVLKTNETENESPVELSVSSIDTDGNGSINNSEGYNLLGNPFGTAISVTELMDALKTVSPKVNSNVYVWDHTKGGGKGGYQILGAGDMIAPFQAFFVRYTTELDNSKNVLLDRTKLAERSTYYNGSDESIPRFSIHLGNGNRFETYEVEFRRDGKIGEDLLDGYKLPLLNRDGISLFSLTNGDVKIAKNVLPLPGEIDGELRLQLGYTVPQSGAYTMRWDGIDEISNEHKLLLIDKKTGREVDLRTATEYAFRSDGSTNEQSNKSRPLDLLNNASKDNTSRFELVIASTRGADDEPETPEKKVKLSPNYPNPFRAQTRMDLELTERMHVKVTVWNIVGQKITTIKDEMMEEGPHPIPWRVTGNMPSGIYICKVEAGGEVITRKMTLVK